MPKLLSTNAIRLRNPKSFSSKPSSSKTDSIFRRVASTTSTPLDPETRVSSLGVKLQTTVVFQIAVFYLKKRYYARNKLNQVNSKWARNRKQNFPTLFELHFLYSN